MFTLQIDDGICKGFKNEEGLDIFVNKAIDEEKGMHALLVFVPKVPEFNIIQVQQPVFYESEAERDRVYTEEINDAFVNDFWNNLINHIKEQKKQQNESN